MSRLLASKTKFAFRKNAALLETEEDPAIGAGAGSVMKRPAGAGIGGAGAESVKKRPAGAGSDAGAESMKKRPATGGAMKRPGAEDCTAIVPVDEPDSNTKDRNKWGFNEE